MNIDYYSYCIEWAKKIDGGYSTAKSWGSFWTERTTLDQAMQDCRKQAYSSEIRSMGFSLTDGTLISFVPHPQFAQ